MIVRNNKKAAVAKSTVKGVVMALIAAVLWASGFDNLKNRIGESRYIYGGSDKGNDGSAGLDDGGIQQKTGGAPEIKYLRRP